MHKLTFKSSQKRHPYLLKIASASVPVNEHQCFHISPSTVWLSSRCPADIPAVSGIMGHKAVKRKPRATRGVSRNGDLQNGGTEHMQMVVRMYVPVVSSGLPVRIVKIKLRKAEITWNR